jgi:hypothetical protein
VEWLCDLDSDGDFDLLWTDYGTTQIWRNNGGFFAPTGEPASSSGVDLSRDNIDGAVCGDVDNDGDLDVFLSASQGPSHLFLNETAPGAATPLGFEGDNHGVDVNANGEAVALGDYDRDGDLDLLINVDSGPNQLWENRRNDGGETDYLTVRVLRCVEDGRVRDDIGATIRLFDEDGITPLGPVREVNGGRGHGSQDPAVIHLGLPFGPNHSYVLEARFIGRDGGPGVHARKEVVPSEIPGYQLLEIEECDIDSPP